MGKNAKIREFFFEATAPNTKLTPGEFKALRDYVADDAVLQKVRVQGLSALSVQELTDLEGVIENSFNNSPEDVSLFEKISSVLHPKVQPKGSPPMMIRKKV